MSTDKPTEPQPQEVYRTALETALEEWRQLLTWERDITIRKNRLRQTFLALCPLVYPENDNVDLTSLSLANAIRMIVGAADRGITAIEMRGRLMDMGYDLSEYENPLASIHTAMNRMVESDEFEWEQNDDNKKRVVAGPELKSVPPPEPQPSNDPLQNEIRNVLANMGIGIEEKK
jgi:hypothetical protein